MKYLLSIAHTFIQCLLKTRDFQVESAAFKSKIAEQDKLIAELKETIQKHEANEANQRQKPITYDNRGIV